MARLESRRNGLPCGARGSRAGFWRRLAPEALESRLLLAVGDFFRSFDNPSSSSQPLSESGTAVAVDAELIAVGAPWDDSAGKSDIGQVHVYEQSSGTLIQSVQSQFPAASGRFGHALDISENRLVVASPFADAGAVDAGIVEVFDASNAAPLATLLNPSPAQLDYFGQAVAIDGDYIVVGAYLDDTFGLDAGVAYVFDTDTAEVIHTLSPPNPGRSDYFGFSVAISGNTIVVGARRADISATDDGAVYLFDAERGTFLREIVNPTPEGFDSFGRSVALDGDVLVVGADGDNTGAPGAGTAYLYAASSGELLHTLPNPTPDFVDLFGYSVGIAGDQVVVGAIRADEGAPDSGGAYVFSAGSGELLATLTDPTPGGLDVFGAAVAVGEELVVVGAYWDDTSGTDAGAAYVFENGSDRLLHSLPNPTLGSFNYFGYAVAVESNLVVVGAPFEDVDNRTDVGEAYLFDAKSGELLSVIANPQPNTSDNFGLAVATSDNLIVVGAYRADDGAIDSGIAYVFEATTGELVSTLRNPTPGRQDYFGFSVAISNGQVLVGSYRDDTDALDAGSAYLFDAETGALLATVANPAPNEFDYFGYSIAMSNEALVVGAYQEDAGATNAGAVYVFDRLDLTRVRQINNPTPQASDQFGLSVAIWGTTLAVGAPRKDLGDFDAGGVYLFHAFTGELRHTIVDAAPHFGGNFGGAIALSHNLLAVGAHRRDFPRVDGGGSVDLFDSTSGVLLRQLENPTPAANDFFGWSVATSSNLTAVGTPLVDGPTTDRGAVSLFFSQPNAAPFVLAGGPYAGMEGSAVEFNAVGIVDDRDPLSALSVEWDFDYDGSEFDVEATGLNPQVVFSDGFSTRPMAVRVTDGSGLAGIATTTLEIADIPPTITLDQTSIVVAESDVAVNTGTYSGDDEITITASVGTIVDHEDGTWTWSFETTDGPDESQTVTILVTDSDELQATVTFDVQVNDVPPEVFAEASTIEVLAGGNATNSGTYSDVGDDDVSLSISTGAVVYEDGSWNWSLLSASLADSQTVTIAATDSDGMTSAFSFDLVVTNVVADRSLITVNEGGPAEQSGQYVDPAGGGLALSASIGEVTDNVDGTWSWAYDAGDGPSDSQTVVISAEYDDATYTTEFELVVENAAPSMSVDESTVEATEGTEATNTGSYADPAGDAISLAASVGTVVDNFDGTWSWSFVPTDGPKDSQTVTITAQDSDGDSTSIEFELGVVNQPPSLSVDEQSVRVLAGATATVTGTFADPGNDVVTLSASVGSVVDQGDNVWEWSFVTASVVDSQTVTITATDEDGETTSTTFELVVSKVDVASPRVTLDEGSTAEQVGGYIEPGDGTLILSASVGTVVDNGDGTWNWSYGTDDGPEDSQAVTITATYDDTESYTVQFELIVNNLPPTVAADQISVHVVEANTATATGTYDDPGDDTVSLTASVGLIVDNGDGTWSWSLDDAGINDSTTVVIEAIDSDGLSASTSFELVVQPRITVDQLTVSVDEGAMVLNSGAYITPAETTVVLSASIGAIVDNGDGTWSWSYDAVDGPDESATVQITADYEGLEVFSSNFELVVNNVVPTIVVERTEVTVLAGTVATNAGLVSDVGDDMVSVEASVGAVVDAGDGTWSWSYTTGDGSDDSQTVKVVATDSDGGASEVTFELVVEPRIVADSLSVSVSEGASASNAGMYVPPVDTTVVLSATIGDVVDNGDGTWSWTFDTVDGPDESATVQVFADYDGDDIFDSAFELVVNNVPPTIAVDEPEVTVADGAVAVNTGSWSDVGDDIVTLVASVGTVVAAGDGTWSWSLPTTDGPNDSQTVTIIATDSDGDVSEVMFDLVDNDSQAGPITLDFNDDGLVDVLDTDAMVVEVVAGSGNALFDLSRDGIVDDVDLAQWLTKAAEHNGLDSAYLVGDADLSGGVDATDLNALALNWGNDVAGWSFGDFVADGRVDSADLNALAINWRQSIDSGPESASMGDGLADGLPGHHWRGRRLGVALRRS